MNKPEQNTGALCRLLAGLALPAESALATYTLDEANRLISILGATLVIVTIIAIYMSR